MLREDYYIFIVIIVILFETVQPQLIRTIEFSKKEKNSYITKPLDSSITLFEIKNSYSNIHIDFGKKQEQVILIRNAISVKIKLSFEIYSPLPEIYETLNNEFCYQSSLFLDTACNKIPIENTQMKWFNMNFSVKWLDNKRGYKLTIEPSNSLEYDLSGFYYCKSTTSTSGMALSNFLEIRDILFWEKNIISISPVPSKSRDSKNLISSEIPKVFSCFDNDMLIIPKNIPYWINIEIKNFVRWAWCPVSKQVPNMLEMDKTYVEDCLTNSIKRCEKQNHLCPVFTGKMPGWTEFVSFDGSITLINGETFNNFGDKLDGYALMCYYQSKKGYSALKFIANTYDSSEKEFTRGLHWIYSVNNRLEFEMISPKKQIIKVGTLQDGFVLTAFYLSPSNYSYEWFQNDKKIFNSNKWTVTPYLLKFNSKISFQLESIYYLRIKSLSNSIEFIFNMSVISPPIIINAPIEPIYSSKYLMINSSYSVSFQYKARPTHANLYINGILYKPEFSDKKVFLKDLSQKAFNLKNLDFNFTKRQLLGGITEFTYSVQNVLYPDTLLRGQDHNLIIEAVNEFGVSRSMLNIYVLKPPKFENLPQFDNCTTQCSSSQPHLFRCELNTVDYAAREVFVEKFWIVNDIRLDSLKHFSIYFKEDKKGLNLLPVVSNNSQYDIALKLLLKEAKLICRVRLLYPGSLNMIEDKLIRENRIIYDTYNDPSVMSRFAAVVRLDWEPNIANASYTWIIFLAIALLLIVMFIFLLVKFTLRGQGKSYQIEKLEIAKGYNRDEEIFENETIKPYHRSSRYNERSVGCQVDMLPIVTVQYRLDKEKAPVLCSECSNTNNHQGNNLDKDSSRNLVNSLNYSPQNGNKPFRPRDILDIIDDEENAIDPSKFNEEGSFIGIYATKNSQTNLPPQIKINNM